MEIGTGAKLWFPVYHLRASKEINNECWEPGLTQKTFLCGTSISEASFYTDILASVLR
jgi:hypothetical protein